MTTGTTARSNRHDSTTFRKDDTMFAIELRLAEVQERHVRFRDGRDAERAASGSSRSLRHRFGQSLVRLGRRIGGEAMTAPAWQG
jgi:hypothetical protein